MKPVSASQELKYVLLRKIWGKPFTAYGLTDENEFLSSHLSDRASTALKAKSYHEEAKKLRSLPEHWMYIVPTVYYSLQVSNGGHHQFFMNSEGAYNQLVSEGLAFFGMNEYVPIFKEALTHYSKDVYEDNKPETWEEFTAGYKDSPLEAIDEQFYSKDTYLDDLLDEYVRTNLSSFK